MVQVMYEIRRLLRLRPHYQLQHHHHRQAHNHYNRKHVARPVKTDKNSTRSYIVVARPSIAGPGCGGWISVDTPPRIARCRSLGRRFPLLADGVTMRVILVCVRFNQSPPPESDFTCR